MTAGLVLSFVLRAAEPLGPRPPAFESIYEEYFDFVWRTLRRLGVAEAALDDAAQDGFVVVYRRLADFRGQSTLKTWLFGIVVRVVRTHRRTALRRGADSLGDREPHCPLPGPAEATERAEARELEHERRFPRGLLLEERLASRTLALCRLGLKAEAEQVAQVLTRHSPQSALWPSVALACGFEK
jgi:RNA polymerase sigma factor (sigma-70 family)